MTSGLSHQIRCPVCLNDLKDPVCLPCEHFYCRGCIAEHMTRSTSVAKCPKCRRPFTQADIRVNRVLKNLVDAAKEHLREHQALKETVISDATGTGTHNQVFTRHCKNHNEELKLFCVTDQKLICVICKEEKTHKGHNFKTLKDAFDSKKQKASEALETLLSTENTLVALINEQAEEILKTMEKSKALSDQMSAQFSKLHQFLNDKEREVKKQLEEEENQILNTMGENMRAVEEMVSDGAEKQALLRSALEMHQPPQFLQWWNEHGRVIMREMSSCNTTYLTLQEFSVIPDTLSLGPYETYLQFFVWKEMLSFIQLVPHHHTVEDRGDQSVSISPSGLCIQPKKGAKIHKNKPNSLWQKTVSSFNKGKHFWELDVGKKVDWGVGVCSCESGKLVTDTVLCFNSDSGYNIQQTHDMDSTVDLPSNPRKIGVYLDCEGNQVSFYNADKMTLIETRVLSKPPPHALYLSAGLYLDGKNSDPLTICWY